MKQSFRKIVPGVLVAVFLSGSATTARAGLADVEAALLNRDYAQAGKLAEDVLAGQSRNSEAQKAQYYIGLSQLRQAQYKEALESLNKIKDEKLGPPLRERVYLGIFDAHYLLEEYQEADATLRELLKGGDKPRPRRGGPEAEYLLPPMLEIDCGTYRIGSDEGLYADIAQRMLATIRGSKAISACSKSGPSGRSK